MGDRSFSGPKWIVEFISLGVGWTFKVAVDRLCCIVTETNQHSGWFDTKSNDLWSLLLIFLLPVTDLSRTTGLNRYSALQPTLSPQPSTTPPQNPDYDSRRTLGRYKTTPALICSSWLSADFSDILLLSNILFDFDFFFFSPLHKSRASTGRERSDKPLISAAPSARPGPFIRGGSSKELLESPNPEEPRRDREREGAEPRRPSVTEDKTEMERSRVREPGENTAQPLQFTYFIQFLGENKRSPEFLVLTR